MAMNEEFAEIYGMRFIGLEDATSSAYGDYNYPNAEAPYPRDIVIDQDGIVRYWSTEYEPHKIFEKIAELLGAAASVGEGPRDVQGSLDWEPIRPNPSGGALAIRWTSPKAGWSLEVFDATGRLVRDLGRFGAGEHRMDWDGRDRAGRRLPAGVYFLRLKNGSETESRRISRID
ncbi:MAG: T9SS type A sorting domain-containing protein [Candidatus Eisenbacteria bacterium]|nr:T9SS type A sorting domain-containing protein [Candidatus Latescibacterota bacterium]MBD3300938.1 T9SS type A sorting domain-containing protein [Candidatus Eisenbacteria bacterium]